MSHVRPWDRDLTKRYGAKQSIAKQKPNPVVRRTPLGEEGVAEILLPAHTGALVWNEDPSKSHIAVEYPIDDGRAVFYYIYGLPGEVSRLPLHQEQTLKVRFRLVMRRHADGSEYLYAHMKIADSSARVNREIGIYPENRPFPDKWRGKIYYVPQAKGKVLITKIRGW